MILVFSRIIMIIKLYVKVTITVFFCHFRLRNLLQRKHMSTSKVEDLTSYLLLGNGRPFDYSIKALILNKIMITFYNNTQLPPQPHDIHSLFQICSVLEHCVTL